MEGFLFMATTTNETILTQVGDEIIELQGDDLAKFIANREQLAKEEEQRILELKEKEIARAALLIRLGITQEEAQLLLGGN